MPPPNPRAVNKNIVVKNLRKNLRLGFGVGAAGGGVDARGGGGGGVKGTLGGTVVDPVGVAGVGDVDVAIFELNVSATRPGGRGWEVAELADPGSTMGFESAMLGFGPSAKPRCNHVEPVSCRSVYHWIILTVFRALTMLPKATRPGCIACH